MKSVFYIGTLAFMIVTSSWIGGPVSVRGKWNKADKKQFSKECNGVKEVKDLGQLGKDLCDCMLKKSEAEFSSFRVADSDYEKMKAIGEDCAAELTSK